MVTSGIGSETIRSRVVGAAGVIGAYFRMYVECVSDSTPTALIDSVGKQLAEVRKRSTAREMFLSFALVPIVLVSIDATVRSSKWVLPLASESVMAPETAVLAVTSSFVHAGSTHLWGNVLGYLLIMSALYPLAVISRQKRALAGVATFNLLAVPLVTGQISLVLPVSGSTQGFSSVNAAFVGSSILFVFFAWHSAGGEIHPIWSVGPAFVSLALALVVAPMVFPYMPPVEAYVPLFWVLGGLLGVCFIYRKGWCVRRHVPSRTNPVLYWGLGVLLLGYARLLVFIPGNANLAAHLGGFYVGFFGLFVLVVARESRRRVRTIRGRGTPGDG